MTKNRNEEKMRILGIDPGTAIVGYSIVEFDKGKLYISDAEDLKKFGSRAEVGKFREARFEKVGELLIIKLNSDKNDSARAVRI